MADNSRIEWTDASWSPIRAHNRVTGKVGWHCEHATPGCEFCYAEGLNLRLGTGLPFKPGHRKDIEIFLDEKMLLVPLRWKRPRRIFVCSMTDAFADFVRDEWIDKMFAVAAMAPQHTFQWLTKRSARMRKWASDTETPRRVTEAATTVATLAYGHHWLGALGHAGIGYADSVVKWPLPHCWLGVSAEDQRRADERVPDLLATPAAVRFVSAEPLLGSINFEAIAVPDSVAGKYAGHGYTLNALREVADLTLFDAPHHLDLAIVGAESGPRARPMELRWASDILAQCQNAGVSCFVKQLSGPGGRALKDMAEFPSDLRIREFPIL